MQEEKFWELLSLQLSGEATNENLEELALLLHNQPELAAKAQLLTQLWQKNAVSMHAPAEFFSKHLQRMERQPDNYFPADSNDDQALNTAVATHAARPALRRWLWPLTGIAAACIVALVILYPAATKKKEPPIAKNTVSTQRGARSAVQLPDGTSAWLNADSKLTYNEHFEAGLREVYLEGEAYFDVVKDKTRPFVIHTKNIDIKVLGTAFNVRAYSTETNTETALFRGSVEITLHSNPAKKIILKPNEKLKVNNESQQSSGKGADKKTNSPSAVTIGKIHFQAKDSSAMETLWLKNKLAFDEETMENVAAKIERWYNVKVIIRGDDRLRQSAYSASFENETLAQVMEALKITGNFKYSISKDTVTIR